MIYCAGKIGQSFDTQTIASKPSTQAIRASNMLLLFRIGQDFGATLQGPNLAVNEEIKREGTNRGARAYRINKEPREGIRESF